MAKDKPAGEAADNAGITAPAVENGVRIAAPPGMLSISVGGISFGQSADGYFVLPAHLVAAAQAHIRSFEHAAAREAKRAADEAARLIAEADIPGRIKALEQRLAAIEAMLGAGVNRG